MNRQLDKYFVPLGEILDALANRSGIGGLCHTELRELIARDSTLRKDIVEYVEQTCIHISHRNKVSNGR